MAVDKVIVTNVSRLKQKYGKAYPKVKAAIDLLIAKDAARRPALRTVLVAIDSASALARVKGDAVVRPDDDEAVKGAIDAVWKHHRPDYLLILGAPDVVPHVLVSNPMAASVVGEEGDDDPTVPTDVPYACDAAFSRAPEDFIAPTRVIGRLPDLDGATDASYIVNLLKRAASYVQRTRGDYGAHFALSARVWQKSTRESVSNLFGPGALVHTSPPGGPRWPKADLAPRVHFINCHGDVYYPAFLGEGPSGNFVDAHTASHLVGRVTEGSVIAAECCYGAQLYPPSKSKGQAGIANTYLAEGAYGFLGSTTIAYGPSEGQGQADFICQFFIEAVMKGASLGRAALEARHRFTAQFSHLDPSDLKTAVQFQLLGDPSLQPIAATPHAFGRSSAVKKALASGQYKPESRGLRRLRLHRTGWNLDRTLGYTVRNIQGRAPIAVRRFLASALKSSRPQALKIRCYDVVYPERANAALGGEPPARQVYVASKVRRKRGVGPAITSVVVTVEGARMVHVRRVHSR